VWWVLVRVLGSVLASRLVWAPLLQIQIQIQVLALVLMTASVPARVLVLLKGCQSRR